MEAYFARLEEKLVPLNLKNPPALLAFGVSAGVKNYAIAGFDGDCGGFQFDMVSGAACNTTQKSSTLFAKARADEFLVIDPMHPAAEEASREGHFQSIPVLRRRAFKKPLKRCIDGFTVNRGDRCDIFWGFQASLDFKRGHAPLDKRGDFIYCGEILRRKQVTLVAEVAEGAVHHEFVGHAARLSALTAIRAPAAEGLAGEALARVGHAQRSVNKCLQRHRGRELFQFPQRQLPRKNDLLHAEPLSEAHTFRGCNSHLRRGVDAQAGEHAARDFC